MAGIRQQIPFYVHGISEQPDELKKPGQVRDAKNALPDVVTGLSKRAGARLINPLGFNDDGTGQGTRKQGTWFDIYRNERTRYIGHINTTGSVEIWDCESGMPMMVYYSDVPLPTGYPETPSNPDNLGRPANDGCDGPLYQSQQNDVLALKNQIAATQAALDALQVTLDSGQFGSYAAGGGTFVDYDYKGDNTYEVKVGYVIVRARGDDFTLTYNQPPGAQIGAKVLDDVTVHPEGGPGWDDDGFWKSGYGDADVYAWIIPETPATEAERQELLNQIGDLQDDLEVYKEDLLVAEMLYQNTASTCGVYGEAQPEAYGNIRTLSEDNLPSYLWHQYSGDIQTLTVNDYTFACNRNVTVSMNSASVNERPYEAFIDLRQVAYNKQYAVDIWAPSNDIQVETTHVSNLTLVTTGYRFDDGDGEGCVAQGTEIYDYEDGNKTNLRFELTVTAQSVLKDPGDPGAGYDCVYQASVDLLAGGDNWDVGDEINVSLLGVPYKLVVDAVSTTTSMAGSQVRPTPTPSTGDTLLSAEVILNDLAAAIEANNSSYTTEIIGNGIYITSPWQILISTPEAQLMNVLSDRVQNIAKLPSQCKTGYQVRVENGSGDEDDYYLQFETKYGGVSGEGAWKEIANPGVATGFNWATMPYQIVRQPDNTFIVSPVEWKLRDVGDNITNPQPSFVKKTINNLCFYRNRLALMSDENIILSRAGDFFNFFATTALKVTPDDPIDIAVASTYPASLFDAIEVNAGLMLFSANQQFLLTTDQDILTPETAKINGISSYRFNTQTMPISMGATIGFVNNAGSRSRFFEMTNIKREGEVDVLEQSKTISQLMPSSLNLLAESRENSLVVLGRSGDEEVWIYRYFMDGEKRIQSAWVRWELTGRLVYHTILGDTYFIVVANTFENKDRYGDEVLTLQRIDLKDNTWSAIVQDDEGYEYSVHMDNYKVVWPDETQYYKSSDSTYFRMPIGYFSSKQLVVYTLKYGKLQGRAMYPNVVIDLWGTWCVIPGNWEDTRMMLGYEFEFSVEFPTIYPQKKTQTGMISDTAGSLIVHRANLNLGPSGVYETVLKRPYRQDYTLMYETRPEDAYEADAVAFIQNGEQTVPIYERNTNVTLELKSSHPSPATLYSMAWEGDYNPRYYSSV